MPEPLNRAMGGPPQPPRESAWAAAHKMFASIFTRLKALEGRTVKDGVGISNALVDAEGRLALTLTDGRVINVGRVVGESAVSISRAEIKGVNLVLNFSDGTSQEVGRVVGEEGKSAVGVTRAEINGTNLVIQYTDGANQDVGRVVGEPGKPGKNAENIEPGSRVEFGTELYELPVGDGKSIFLKDCIVDGEIVGKVIA